MFDKVCQIMSQKYAKKSIIQFFIDIIRFFVVRVFINKFIYIKIVVERGRHGYYQKGITN